MCIMGKIERVIVNYSIIPDVLRTGIRSGMKKFINKMDEIK